MNIKRAIVPIFAAVFAFATAQNFPPTVEASAPKKVVAGKAFTTTVTVKFADGLHGYQNPPTKDYMIPVKITPVTKGLTLAKVAYPKGSPMEVTGEGTVMVYEGTVKIPVTITAPKKAGKYTFELSVGYQQCNAEACFPPASENKKITVEVTKK